MVLIPCGDGYDPASGAYPSSEDLDFDKWFCQRRMITSLCFFPGTDCYLENGYDIIAVRQSRRRPGLQPTCSSPNTTLDHLFAVPWRGNLIVVKRGRRDRTRAVNITRRELTLINTLVERWISR